MTATDAPTTPAVPAETDVLIVGGGPAGSLLAALLSRRGIRVVLAEKHRSIEREFRGETVAAPSVTSLRALGFGAAMDAHGFLETLGVTMRMEGRDVMHVDYGRLGDGTLPIDIPQPALIGAFMQEAGRFDTFTSLPGTAFSDLVTDADGTVRGAVLKLPDGGRATVRARVVVGADGRFSKVRHVAGLEATITPMGRDFQWFKLRRPQGWGNTAELVVDGDHHLVVLPTFPDTLRIGHNLPKGGLGTLRKAGFAAFRSEVLAIDPRLESLFDESVTSFADTSFLEIFTAEVPRWSRDGLLLIGDASHTCTPILGQGVNLAFQDVVQLTPVLAAALASGNGREPIPASAFDRFVATRRKHKDFVTKFQRMQETNLGKSSARDVRIRRLRFGLLHRLPIKYRLFSKVIAVQHPIDPVDLELAQRAAAATWAVPGTTAGVPVGARA
ncbi:MAG: FAD-dependent monooxygenase [Kineosporiaceae bacterium]